MSAPLVSAIMPARNAETSIANAIASVLEQTMPDLELIVVDDASTDRTAAAVDAVQDRRVRLLRSDRNIRYAAARNLALRHAKGQWAAFLDADDEWTPARLECLLLAARGANGVYVADLEALAVPGPSRRLQRAVAPRPTEDGSVAEMDLDAALALGHDVRLMVPLAAFHRGGLAFPERGSCGEWTFLLVRLAAQGIPGWLVRRAGYLYRAVAQHDSSTLRGKEEMVAVFQMLGSDPSLPATSRRLIEAKAEYARQGLVTAALREGNFAMAFHYAKRHPATLLSLPGRALLFLAGKSRVFRARAAASRGNMTPESPG